MTGPVLNAAAQLVCPHGGKVTIAPKQELVLAGELPALGVADLVGAPILRCQLRPTGVMMPCTNVVSVVPAPGIGQSLTGVGPTGPLLLAGVQALTNSRPVPGIVKVVFPGQVLVEG